MGGTLTGDDIDKIVSSIMNAIGNSSKSDSEKGEKIIADYVERSRTLQRNYLIMIGLALFFVLLFSFPFFSVEDALHNIESQNHLNNLETNLSFIKGGSNISEKVKELEHVKKEIMDATPSVNSPWGTLKIGLTQIVLFYPVVLSIGFIIVCLELTEIMRFGKSVKSYSIENNNKLYDELKNRAPGIIDIYQGHHLIVFVLLPLSIIILSIVLNSFQIIFFNADLTTLYKNYGAFAGLFIPTLYGLSVGFAVYFIYIVWRDFNSLTSESTGKVGAGKSLTQIKTWIKTKGWKTISIIIIIVLVIIIAFLLSIITGM